MVENVEDTVTTGGVRPDGYAGYGVTKEGYLVIGGKRYNPLEREGLMGNLDKFLSPKDRKWQLKEGEMVVKEAEMPF